MPSSADDIEIRDVWNSNLEGEIEVIRGIVDEYPYIALDTEFPGKIYQVPQGTIPSDLYTKEVKPNVDDLKLIQLGFTFTNGEGQLPTCYENPDKYLVWQFNFQFDRSTDKCMQNSIEFLSDNGMEWEAIRQNGIEALRFGELLMSSGVVLSDKISWLTFHGIYDFAYLLKILTGSPLPQDLDGFLQLVKLFFPIFFDIRHLVRYGNGLMYVGGLETIGQNLGVQRIGSSHQAGSDSLSTSRVFFELQAKHSSILNLDRDVGFLHFGRTGISIRI